MYPCQPSATQTSGFLKASLTSTSRALAKQSVGGGTLKHSVVMTHWRVLYWLESENVCVCVCFKRQAINTKAYVRELLSILYAVSSSTSQTC